jgi:hypothetical protein
MQTFWRISFAFRCALKERDRERPFIVRVVLDVDDRVVLVESRDESQAWMRDWERMRGRVRLRKWDSVWEWNCGLWEHCSESTTGWQKKRRKKEKAGSPLVTVSTRRERECEDNKVRNFELGYILLIIYIFLIYNMVIWLLIGFLKLYNR